MLLLLLIIAIAALCVVLFRRTGGLSGRTLQAAGDAESDARRWVDRLGAGVSSLDAGTDRAARQALADASERYTAATSQLSTARSTQQFALVRQTALEGLYYIRAARTALGLDPGPDLPAAPTAQDGRFDVDGQEYVSSSRPSDQNPYYYPGGMYRGRTAPAGWYSRPWWQTAAVAGAAGLGGMVLADLLLGEGHHHWGGPPMGGPGGPGW